MGKVGEVYVVGDLGNVFICLNELVLCGDKLGFNE